MKRVLIVDDDQHVRILLGELLSYKGYDCTLASNVAATRDRLKRDMFELVISDFDMPEESGLLLLKHIRCEYPQTMTIMISGSGDMEVKREALKLGAGTYIEKLFTVTEIFSFV